MLARFAVRALTSRQVLDGSGGPPEESMHAFSLGRHHLLNTEGLQRNPRTLDHRLRPHALNSDTPHEGGGAFDRPDPTDSAVYLKSDQSANKKK